MERMVRALGGDHPARVGLTLGRGVVIMAEHDRLKTPL